jgi:hypothetical protein
VNAPPAVGIDMRGSPGGAKCARTIRAVYDGEFLGGSPIMLRLTIRSFRPYALVLYSGGDAAGTSLFHRRGAQWCRTSTGPGAVREQDVIGFDGIDKRMARWLFNARPTTSTDRDP